MSLWPSALSGKIRNILWPIEKSELRLFLPMALLALCLLFNFSALRSIKDSLVVPSIGAEVISFLKLYLVLPSAIIFTIIYVKLSNMMQLERIFYVIVSTFLAIYALFAYLLYPSQEYYHPSVELTEALIASLPHAKWFLKILGQWSYAIMYIFAELWSVVVINLMFWQFANHIIATDKAKRFYPMILLIGNIGLVIAGNMIVYFADSLALPHLLWVNFFGGSYHAAEITVKLVVSAVILSGIIAMLLFKYIHSYILEDSTAQKLAARDAHDTQTKLSIADSISLIMKSKYIGYIIVMIICYGLVINILEGPWKAKVKELYPTTQEYISFMGEFNIWMGVSSVFFMFICSNMLRNFGWFVSAIMTPTIIAITGAMFFLFVVFEDVFYLLFGNAAFSPAYAAVIAGALQNILSKSTKYSLFDSTKEMAYIPLSKELRTKGKAAAEVVGAKLGKSLGAFVQSAIFVLVPTATFDSIAPMLMVVFVLVMILWLMDVKKLNEEYTKITQEDKQ
jgi:AAA family ATP:ADP antiporter